MITIWKITLPQNRRDLGLPGATKRRSGLSQAVGVQPSRMRYALKNMSGYLETSTARFIMIVNEHTCYANLKSLHSLKSESSAPSKPKT